MAFKFAVAVALFALCHANPAYISGESRDGRAYAISQAQGSGANLAQVNVQDNVAQAYGSTNEGSPLARNENFPGLANAQAQTFGAGQVFAQAQNQGYYQFPAPANVIAYEQNFAVPSYKITGAEVDAANTAAATATLNGAGAAKSYAQTQEGSGNNGLSSSNAESSGFGSATSNTKSGLGSTSTSANTQGGSASSSAQSSDVANYVPVVSQVPQGSIIDAKTPIFYTTYDVPNTPVASSSANVNGFGNAASSARINRGRTISWRFGTLYDNPANAYVRANTQSGYGAAKSAANTNGFGSANANADVTGNGSAQSAANIYPGSGAFKSYGYNSGYGSAKSTANVYGSQYGGSRANAQANTQGYGSAQANARTNY